MFDSKHQITFILCLVAVLIRLELKLDEILLLLRIIRDCKISVGLYAGIDVDELIIHVDFVRTYCFVQCSVLW